MTGRRTYPEQHAQMLALRDQGLTQAQVAIRLGVSEATVQRHTRGQHKAPNTVAQGEIAEMLALREKGLTQAQIAARIGRHQRTVERYTCGTRAIPPTVTDQDIAEMLDLAAEGLCRAEQARAVGREPSAKAPIERRHHRLFGFEC